jgi:hypothetical protein
MYEMIPHIEFIKAGENLKSLTEILAEKGKRKTFLNCYEIRYH